MRESAIKSVKMIREDGVSMPGTNHCSEEGLDLAECEGCGYTCSLDHSLTLVAVRGVGENGGVGFVRSCLNYDSVNIFDSSRARA